MADFRISHDGMQVVITLDTVVSGIGQVKVDAFTDDKTGTFWDVKPVAGGPPLTQAQLANVQSSVERTAALLVENNREDFDRAFAKIRR